MTRLFEFCEANQLTYVLLVLLLIGCAEPIVDGLITWSIS